MAPEEVMRAWVREFNKEGIAIDTKRFMPQKGPETLPTEEVGGREDLFLVGTEQEDEQRLRASAEVRRSLYLRCYESPDGEEIGPLMRVVRQFLYAVLGNCATFGHSLSYRTCIFERSARRSARC
jgi:hypothetical protein